MPTYEYFCDKHGEFEEFHSISIKLEFCPQCEDEGNKQEVKRLISGGSGRGIINLSGNDLVEKTKSDSKQLERDLHSNANKYANFLGENKYHQIQTQMDRRGK